MLQAFDKWIVIDSYKVVSVYCNTIVCVYYTFYLSISMCPYMFELGAKLKTLRVLFAISIREVNFGLIVYIRIRVKYMYFNYRKGMRKNV